MTVGAIAKFALFKLMALNQKLETIKKIIAVNFFVMESASFRDVEINNIPIFPSAGGRKYPDH